MVSTKSSSDILRELPQAGLIELSGPIGGGKTELILRYLAQRPGVRVAWVEDDATVYPCAFPQRGAGLDRVLFVDASAGDSAWAVLQILKSQLFPIVVLQSNRKLEIVALRRLQLAAEKAKAQVFMITEMPTRQVVWPFSVQLQITRAPGTADEFVITVLKRKGLKPCMLTETA